MPSIQCGVVLIVQNATLGVEYKKASLPNCSEHKTQVLQLCGREKLHVSQKKYTGFENADTCRLVKHENGREIT